MAETATKLPVKTERKGSEGALAAQSWRPLENLRREVNRLFEDFGRETWLSPFRRSVFDLEPLWRREITLGAIPAVDIVDKKEAYEVTADVPGFDEKNIEVKVVNGDLVIRGERKSEKEEKKENYYLSERDFGAFERRFNVPEGVNADKIEATLKNGVLTVRLPKKPEAQKPAKTIEVKAAA